MTSLTARIGNVARYLPAIQPWFAEDVEKPGRASMPIQSRDLNFLKPDALWCYGFCLASAILLLDSERNAITRRSPHSTWVLGDSGGYQIGTGKGLRGFDNITADKAAARWRSSIYSEDILRWLELNCDCAMTLDFPLWLKLDRFRASPFHGCSVELLTDLTVENLRYFADNRGRYGSCEFLNVLHGRTEAEEDYWYRRVREFDFEGWAIGGSVGNVLDLRRLLKRLLLLRDDGMLISKKRRVHILGVSQLKWAVVLTAIQRSIQRTSGPEFAVSFDTSTPFVAAARYQKFAVPPVLTADIDTWAIQLREFPNGYGAAVVDADEPFPPGSPLSDLLTLGDMNPVKDPYAARTFDRFSDDILANHNCYVTLSAIIDANKAALGRGPLPQALADLIGLIEELFKSETWLGLLQGRESLAIVKAAGLGSKEAAGR